MLAIAKVLASGDPPPGPARPSPPFSPPSLGSRHHPPGSCETPLASGCPPTQGTGSLSPCPDPGLSVVRSPGPLGIVALAVTVLSAVEAPAARAYVALMAGQSAQPLRGAFNNVPVLHSNQPEEVTGPGILINTAPGQAMAVETGQWLRNAEFSFDGEFGLHLHHKYFPPSRGATGPDGRRPELTIATVLINPGVRPVHIRFENGAVRNSFEAPYLANNLMGVKPLGPRPWNTGPGDATAVQMLRGRLDPRLSEEITIPARSRLVLFTTRLPALGIANALLRGRSDGPFQMAVVAAKRAGTDEDVLMVLDAGQLAPGRIYLDRVSEINNRMVFSRVGGVALGDRYRATVRHNLQQQGPLHVPFTSTNRHHFGTGEVQVNPLASRMIDSSLDNVGTYGVRFDVDLQLRGSGPYELVMSHPSPSGGRNFTAFRGSLEIDTPAGRQDVHVGLRSGQSLSLASLQLDPSVETPVRVSMVYPADATPGHLLSVVPSSQLAMLRERERQLELARLNRPVAAPATPPPLGATASPAAPPSARSGSSDTGPLRPPPDLMGTPTPSPPRPGWLVPPPPPPGRPRVSVPAVPPASGGDYVDRYRQAIEEQRRMMQGWQAP